jgi:hypothetical protein
LNLPVLSPIRLSLDFIALVSAVLLAVVGALFLAVLAHRLAQDAVALWLAWRAKAFRPAFHKWLEKVPGDYAALLRPRLWGDYRVLEGLLVEVISRYRGALRRDAVDLAERLGVVRWRVGLLAGAADPWLKADLAEKLGVLGSDHALPALLECLKHPHPDVQYIAARSLSRIGRVEAADAVLGLALSRPPEQAARFVQIFIAFGREAAPRWRPLLEAREPAWRWLGTVVLRECLDAASEPAFRRMLKEDPSAEARAAAAGALGRLPAAGGAEALADSIGDPSPQVRLACAEALARFAGDPALRALETALEDPEWEVRVQAVRSLASSGPAGRMVLEKRRTLVDENLRLVVENILSR